MPVKSLKTYWMPPPTHIYIYIYIYIYGLFHRSWHMRDQQFSLNWELLGYLHVWFFFIWAKASSIQINSTLLKKCHMLPIPYNPPDVCPHPAVTQRRWSKICPGFGNLIGWTQLLVWIFRSRMIRAMSLSERTTRGNRY